MEQKAASICSESGNFLLLFAPLISSYEHAVELVEHQIVQQWAKRLEDEV
jgi:hypothetical protein